MKCLSLRATGATIVCYHYDNRSSNIVKNGREEVLEYVKQVRDLQNESSNIRDVLIAFNNHFAGFGPQSVNDFLNLMNMSEIDWKTELERYENSSGQSNKRHQSSLSDFHK